MRHFEVKLITCATRYLSFQQGSGASSSRAEVLYRQLLRGMCGILADKILGRKINLIGAYISVSYLLPCSLNRFFLFLQQTLLTRSFKLPVCFCCFCSFSCLFLCFFGCSFCVVVIILLIFLSNEKITCLRMTLRGGFCFFFWLESGLHPSRHTHTHSLTHAQ